MAIGEIVANVSVALDATVFTTDGGPVIKDVICVACGEVVAKVTAVVGVNCDVSLTGRELIAMELSCRVLPKGATEAVCDTTGRTAHDDTGCAIAGDPLNRLVGYCICGCNEFGKTDVSGA